MPQAMKIVSPNFSDLMAPNIEIGKFPDGDSHLRVPDLKSYNGQDIMVFHRLYPDQNNALVELLLILDALRHEKASSITVVSPYLPYSRQDKKSLDGEIASAYVVCNLLARAGCTKFITFDCHFLNQEGEAKFGELNIKNISMSAELIAQAKEVFAGEAFEIIGPDDGANYLVKDSGGQSLKKVRKAYQNGTIDYRQIETMEGDFEVKGKNVLLLDDMISTGNTMITALERMMESGAKRVVCAATHGLFLYNCLDRLRKRSETIFSTDSIISSQSTVSIKPKLEQL